MDHPRPVGESALPFGPIAGGRGARLLVLPGCLLFGWLCGPNLLTMLVSAGLAWGVASAALRRIAAYPARRERALWLGSLALAGFFCLILPMRLMTDRDQLYTLAVNLNLPAPLSRAANLAENLLIAGLTLLVAFCAVFVLWTALREAPARPGAGSFSRAAAVRAVLLYALPGLLVWAVFLYAFWPGVMLIDTYWQWEQFQDLSGRLNDWHPVMHTLLQYALTRLWFSPASVAMVQVLALALAWGWAMTYFEQRGLPRKGLFLLSWGFALLPYNAIQIITLMKDELYTVFCFALVLLVGIIWASRGQWLARRGSPLILGAVLALPFLARHNGLLLVGLVPAALFLAYRRLWKRVLFSTLAAVLLILLLRSGLAFGLLGAAANPDSVLYVLPIQHISAVGKHGGVYTTEQQAVLSKIAPIEAWRSAYNPNNADSLSKTWGELGDPEIHNKISQNQAGLLRVFLELAARYPGVMLRSELDLLTPVWAITFPEKEPSWHYKYEVKSAPVTEGIDPAIPYQPNLNTPLAQALSQYLRASNRPAVRPIFWHGGLYLFLTLALLVMCFFLRGRDSLLLFAVSLGNVLSLFLAMPMQAFRYMYPFVAVVILLVLFAYVGKEKQG